MSTISAIASGDQIIRLPSNSDGVITTDLSAWAGGSYTVRVAYIDETDGVSTAKVLVDGVEMGAWSFDGVSGTQTFPGRPTGTGAQAGNQRTIDLDLPFVIEDGSVLTLELSSDAGEVGRVDYIELVPADVGSVNQAPTVALANVVADIAEDTDTSAAIKVADIVVTDDALGTNVLGLTGADAGSFVIVGTELFLQAGVALDFESKTRVRRLCHGG